MHIQLYPMRMYICTDLYRCALPHCRTSKRLSLTAPTKSWSWSTKERQLQCGVALCYMLRSLGSVFYVSCNISCSLLRSFIVPTWSLFFHECLWMLLKFHTCLKSSSNQSSRVHTLPGMYEACKMQQMAYVRTCDPKENYAASPHPFSPGFEHRATAATQMNATSSRSHCLFIIKMHQKESLRWIGWYTFQKPYNAT